MAGQRKGRKKLSPKQHAKALKLEQRRAEAIRLKLAGHGYRAIAATLGINVHTAYDDVQAVLDETRKQARNDAEQERRLQLERIDLMVEKLTGLLDDREKAARAAEVIRGLEERRAKLLGLDSPSKFEHAGPEGGPITLDARDALFERIAGLVAGTAAGGAAGEDPREPQQRGR